MSRASRALLVGLIGLGALAARGSSAADGQWAQVSALGRYGHAAVLDPLRHRLLVFGGRTDSHVLAGEVWALALDGTGTWTRLLPTGTPPSARAWHSAIYDAARDRMIVFGGYDGSAYRNDVWALELAGVPAWVPVPTLGVPPTGRYGSCMIHDAIRDRIVLYGGWNGYFCDDVWTLSLAATPTWSAITPLGPHPPLRMRASAIHDPDHDRMLVFGGSSGGTYYNDVFALSLDGTPTWSAVPVSGAIPTARSAHSATFDPVRQQMVVFGGHDGTRYLNDVRVLALAGPNVWSTLTLAGRVPGERREHATVYDPVSDRLVLFGGYDGRFYDDVWSLPLDAPTAWTAWSPDGALPALFRPSTIYDPRRHRLIVFGGYDGSLPRNEVWALALGGAPVWTRLQTLGVPPTPRWSHSAVYDATRDRMVVFGGWSASPAYLGDSWALSLDGDPTWTELHPAAPLPAARYGHTAIYDRLRQRMLVFGGLNVFSRNDLWELALGDEPRWTLLATTGGPPAPRYSHSAIHDPVRDRMVIHGGTYQSATAFTLISDLWTLDLANAHWMVHPATGSLPFRRENHGAIYDAERDRMVVFGGMVEDFGYYGTRNDVWVASLDSVSLWSRAFPAGSAPETRMGQAAFYDPLADRMLISGGEVGVPYNTVWAIQWAANTAVDEPAPAPAGLLGELAPNPSTGRTTVRFSNPRAGRLRLRVFDLHGRAVRSLLDDLRGPGDGQVSWDALDDRGVRVQPGLYLIRLESPGGRAVRKLVLTAP